MGIWHGDIERQVWQRYRYGFCGNISCYLLIFSSAAICLFKELETSIFQSCYDDLLLICAFALYIESISS
jgi:hypothetical protein